MTRRSSHAAWGALLAVGCIVGGAHIDPSLDDEGSGGRSGSVGVDGDDDEGGGLGGTATGSGGTISVGGTSKGGTTNGGSSGGSGRGGSPTGGAPMTGGSGGDSGESGESSGGTGGDGGGGSGGRSMGGFAGIGGMGGVAGTSGSAGKGGTAGTSGTAGSAGKGGSSATGGSAGTGGVNTDPQCVSIKSNMACVPEGQQCPNLACGLGDVGRRQCNCATTWTCASCNWAGTVLETKPPNAETPCNNVVELGVCATAPGLPASVCKSVLVATEYCMCAIDPRAPVNPPEWDCDSAPSSW